MKSTRYQRYNSQDDNIGMVSPKTIANKKDHRGINSNNRIIINSSVLQLNTEQKIYSNNDPFRKSQKAEWPASKLLIQS